MKLMSLAIYERKESPLGKKIESTNTLASQMDRTVDRRKNWLNIKSILREEKLNITCVTMTTSREDLDHFIMCGRTIDRLAMQLNALI